MVNKVPKSDLIIILRDVNAKLWKESAYQKITGKHTLHEETNRNGEFLCDFAAANNMTVTSTQFQHKQIHSKMKYLRCTKKQHKMDGIDITQTHLEQVNSFKYSGSIVNGNNSIEEEIKERISLGNRHFMQIKTYLKVNY
jgi:galactitol-specific phosphotransferase system IIB component